MKNLWFHNALAANNRGNCLPQDENSAFPSGLLPLKPKLTKQDKEEWKKNVLESQICLPFEDLALVDVEYSLFYLNCLAYIAGNIVFEIEESVRCILCSAALFSSEMDPIDPAYRNLIDAKTNGRLKYPSKSVYTIVYRADYIYQNIMKQSNDIRGLDKVDDKMCIMTVTELMRYDLFPTLGIHSSTYDPDFSEFHSVRLIKLVIKQYQSIRMHHDRVDRRLDYGISSQHRNHKLTIFAGW